MPIETQSDRMSSIGSSAHVSTNDAATETLRVAVALLGARCHYAVPRILEQHGMLAALYTDIYARDWPARALEHLVPRKILPAAARRLVDRQIPDIPPEKVKTYPWFGLRRAWSHARRRTPGAVLAGYAVDNGRFCRRVLRTGLDNAQAIYVFNGAGLELMQYARAHGIATIHEQTIAPYSLVEPLLEAERKLWSGWEAAEVAREEWLPLAEREHREWELADAIVCGSDYVADGVNRQLNNASGKCVVIPYGVNLPSAGHPRDPVVNRPLRVLFLGTLELRKGIQYLTEAAEGSDQRHVTFRAVGPIRITESSQSRVRDSIELTGPIARSRLMEQLDWADVFLLPTLAEGSAIVVYEALAAGLPVITTPNAGSVLRDGVEGFLVPVRDPRAIVERLQCLLDEPDLLPSMSRAALARAQEFTVERYGARLLEVFRAFAKRG